MINCATCHQPILEGQWSSNRRHYDAGDCVKATVRRCIDICNYYGDSSESEEVMRREFGVSRLDELKGEIAFHKGVRLQ